MKCGQMNGRSASSCTAILSAAEDMLTTYVMRTNDVNKQSQLLHRRLNYRKQILMSSK
jgi:hypothetical protein